MTELAMVNLLFVLQDAKFLPPGIARAEPRVTNGQTRQTEGRMLFERPKCDVALLPETYGLQMRMAKYWIEESNGGNANVTKVQVSLAHPAYVENVVDIDVSSLIEGLMWTAIAYQHPFRLDGVLVPDWHLINVKLTTATRLTMPDGLRPRFIRGTKTPMRPEGCLVIENGQFLYR